MQKMCSRSQALVSAIIAIHYLAIFQCVNCQAPVDQSTFIKIAVPNLPLSHYRFWLKNYPRAFKEYTKICSETKNTLDLADLDHFKSLHANLTFDDLDYLDNLDHGKYVLNSICSKLDIVSKSCWGYENNCQLIYLMPECEKGIDEQENKIAWFSQADFGYILDRRREMNKYCSPDKYSNDSVKSSLDCTKFFRTCRGDNLMIKFDTIPKNGSLIRPQVEPSVIKRGDIGGWNCDLQLKRIPEEDGQRGPLQSWFNELSNYDKMEHVPPGNCDLYIDKQAFIIKLDSPANLYHYLSSFLNLYATLHLNNKFSDDNQIIIWDNQLPRSKFDTLWKAFTRNPLKSITDFENKRVCFKKFVFTLMPRMVDGLFYNTKLTPGCSKSGLFDAFNKHVLHKLKISQDIKNNILHNSTSCGVIEKIKITFSIRSTPHRRILNQEELAAAIEQESNHFLVQLVDFQKQNFLDQLKIVHNTDILIGIHGAGLAHTLFLPDWAVLYELHACQDNCYHDLARLRGVSYISPNDDEKNKFVRKIPVEDQEELRSLNRSNLLKYDKYWNFVFDKVEFLRLFNEAVEKVRKNHPPHLRPCAETEKDTNPKEAKKDPVTGGAEKDAIGDAKREPVTEATKKNTIPVVKGEPVIQGIKKYVDPKEAKKDSVAGGAEKDAVADAKREPVTEATKKNTISKEAKEEPIKIDIKDKLFRRRAKKNAMKDEIKKETEDISKEETQKDVNRHTEL